MTPNNTPDDPKDVAGDRGITSVNAAKPKNKALQAAVLAGGTIAIMGVAYLYLGNSRPSAPKKAPPTATTVTAATATGPVTSTTSSPDAGARLDDNLPKLKRPDDAPPAPRRPLSPGERDPGLAASAAAARGDAPPPPRTSNGSVSPDQRAADRDAEIARKLEFERQRAPLLVAGNNGASGRSAAPQGRPSASSDTPKTDLQGAIDKYVDALAGNGKVQGGALTPASFSPDSGAQSATLAGKLTATKISGVQAATLGNRDFLLTQGTFLDCTLETNLDSTVPGLTKCIVASNIYSTSGRVILIERGTKIIGQYQGGLKQGEARIFVLWTRAETPNGVIVDLNSPGTDTLGAAGLPGFVDSHFWDRFGAALLISVIQDGFGYLQATATEGGTVALTGNSQQAGQQLAQTALQSTVNIPPTLYKNHGDSINVLIARDLDFSTVYTLSTTAAPEPIRIAQ